MNWNQLLSAALDIGEQMEVSGAEVYRVEDCIRRICFAYGATDVDVFTITSSIVLTIQQPDGERLTQTRRIETSATNLQRVDQLNRLSREMCDKHLSYSDFSREFAEIMEQKPYPRWMEFLFYAIIAGAFTVFVGGVWQDGLCAMVIGAGLRAVVLFNENMRFNRVFSSMIASFYVSVLAFLSVKLSLGITADHIITGNIMLLIPGVALTNSLRDIISGDTMSGLLRFFEACVIALAIAAGYLLASGVF